MDFSKELLDKNAQRWNYTDAVLIVKKCEEYASLIELHKLDDLFTKIAAETYSKAIITTKEILTLLYNGYPEGAMALSRILYESMVIIRFLYERRSDHKLLERYIDDFYVKVSRDKIKYYSYICTYSQDKRELEDAQQRKSAARKEHNKLKEKYSEFLTYNKQGSYLHDYWWIGNVLPSRNFGAIQNETALENLKILYIISCYRAHSGVVGNAIRFGTLLDETTLSTGGSLEGFQVPFCFSFVCFGILTETLFDCICIDSKEITEKIEELIAPFENYLYR
ncbi:MAG: hypothetical protein IIY78_02870 [Clostridia bacterium]|nr:hypothetical protein [Clostridia bacterium]